MRVPQDIVVALIWRQGNLLVGLRPEGKSCPLLWEFPGGKCEPGESHAQALARECQEELGVEVVVGAQAHTSRHGDDAQALSLFFYHCELASAAAQPEPRCTLALQWLHPEHLPKLDFCPGDLDLVAALAAGGVRPPEHENALS